MVERELVRQVGQGHQRAVRASPPAVIRVVAGTTAAYDGDEPAARVALRGVPDTDLTQVVGGHLESPGSRAAAARLVSPWST